MRALLIGLLLAAPVAADQMVAYGKRVFRSDDGAFVIETKEKKPGKIDYVIRSKEGRVRGKGTIDHMPVDLALFKDGTGFIVWGRYEREGKGVAVARYDFDGTVRWKHDFKKLFDKQQIEGFMRTLSFVLWAKSVWIDPTRGEAIGTTTSRIVLKFNMRTGEIRPGGMDAVLDSLKLTPPPLAGVEAAGEWFPDRAREQLVKIAGDEANTVAVRMAAVTGAGRPGEYGQLFRDALEDDGARMRAVQSAIALLPEKDALDLLERAALRKDVGLMAIEQLGALNGTAQLVTVLSHGDTPASHRKVAGAVLKKMPKDDVLKGVLKEFGDADPDTAAVMLDTLIAVDGKSLHRRMQRHQQKLIQLLDRKNADVLWLAGYFAKVPTTEAVQPLMRAARRMGGKPKEQRAVFEALRKCTGYPIGDNLAEWEKATRR